MARRLLRAIHRSPSGQLALIVVAALLIRLALWALPLHQLANDEHEYVRVARDLLAGRGWSFYESYHWLRAPLYPLFLAASLALAGGDLQRAALPNLALSTLNVLLASAIAREIAPPALARRAGLIAATLSALLLTFATFASLYMLETLFATLLGVALLALLRYRSRPRLALVALAGCALGLAALTRSLALPLLPLGVLYIIAAGWGTFDRSSTRSFIRAFVAHSWRIRGAFVPTFVAHALVFALAGLLTIAPWTLRNYLAYGRLIPIETGLSFNTWAFNEPREDMATIFRALEAIPNPAERADYATARGVARLREDPAIIWRKLDDNWFALWRVKPIEDRYIQQDYYSDVGLGYFVWSLAFDDALLLLILLAACWGLVVGPGWQARLLLGGWIVGTVASILLTHGEARYRHALFPALLPYAAVALAALTSRSPRLLAPRPPGGQLPAHSRLRLFPIRGSFLAAGALSAIIAYTFLSSYPWLWAEQRLARGLLQLQGDAAWARGDEERAIERYARASAAQPDSVDALIVLGLAQREHGQFDAAAQTLRAAWRLRPTYIPASSRLGDLLRSRGDLDGARRAFAGAYADAQTVADWSWANLQPPPARRVDVGDGLDFGYVGGVFPAEQQRETSARWTGAQATLRVAASGQAQLLRLRLAAPRPDGIQPTIQVCAQRRCQPLNPGSGWAIYELLLPPAPGPVQSVEIRSSTFESPDDGRRLGILLDWFVTSPAP
jgi:tetratricopeptide (TPR) repeat protein